MSKKASNSSGSFRRRKNGLWEYRVSYGTDYMGKPVRKSFYGETQADCRKKKSEYDKLQIKAANAQTVAEWAIEWLSVYKNGKCAYNTYTQYKSNVEKYIIPELGQMKLVNVKPVHIMSFLNKYSNMSQSHVSKLKITLNGIFDTAVDNELCARNPVRKIKAEGLKPKEKEIFSEDEIKTIVSHCEKERSNISDAMLTLLYTGLRREELLGLMWKDIDFDKNTIHICRTVIAQGNKKTLRDETKNKSSTRTIPIMPQLKTILETKPKTSQFVFPAQNGDFYSPHRFNDCFKRLLERINRENNADIKILTPHSCRHTMASLLLAKGVSLKIIQQILGHSSIVMTGNVYTHTNIEVLQQAVEKIEF